MQALTYSGLGIALLIVAAQIMVPFGVIPVTLQSLAVFSIIMLFSPMEAVATIGGYILLGALGLPVGAGFNGGLGWLLGPTGGFLAGFLLASIVAAVIRKAVGQPSTAKAESALDICLGLTTLVCYYCLGAAWLMFVSQTTLAAAAAVAVLPFLVPDAAKLLAAISCVRALRKVLRPESLNELCERCSDQSLSARDS